MIRYVGLDVHKRIVQACILDASGKVVAEERVELSTGALETFARLWLSAEDHVIVEATTNTWAIVDVLRPLVAKILVSNPIQTKAIAQAKVKTDKVDARVLAQLLRLNFVPLVWEPDGVTRDLRRWTGHRSPAAVIRVNSRLTR